ncbi:HHIP-like protein 2 isoform X1 [Asterias rubens]|uniref:HHIP-like protein 2 isoform X1 n=1 Tax=Asterias rubens TaxID=7604 RepID=UPI00145546C7|nr:HHIP-like protein 2 isoform X1 [Asterias rubens]
MAVVKTSSTKLLLSFITIVCLAVLVDAHPQCLDFFPPFNFKADDKPQFCTLYNTFGCCTVSMDSEIEKEFNRIASEYNSMSGASPNCLEFLKDILCQPCSPYAAHLYDAEGSQERTRQYPGLCLEYCTEFHQSCSDIIPLIINDPILLQAAQNSTADFCAKMAIPDVDYCFPDVLNNEDLIEWADDAESGSGLSQCLCLEEFANGLRNPLLAIHANDSTHRLFIAEQIGVISVFLENRTRLEEPFLDIRETVLTSDRRGDERGLLGAAFHPNSAENDKFYVFYSTGDNSDQKVRISEFTILPDDRNKVNASSEKVILEVDEPYANHNGGQLLFGLDGYLYVTIGDGGAAGDPQDNGLDKSTLLGKILRIDVNHETDGMPYSIPPDNPFINANGAARPEIYAYGVRNMWRCAEDRGDRETGYGKGRIFCGDVGQNAFEEIDIIVNGGNYGWRAKEGFSCYSDSQCTDEWLENEVLPIHAYPHTVGKSVTGGFVYRGCQSPNLNGRYIYGDFVNGRLFQLTENNETTAWDNQEICMADSSTCLGSLVNSYPKNILSFGEDEAGEVYILATNYASTEHDGGKVYKLVDPGRRGNPAECVTEDRREFEVTSPMIPFIPSTPKDQRARPRVCTTGEDQGLVNNQTVCSADVVLAGQVVSTKLFSRNRRVTLKVLSLDYRAKHVPKVRKELSVTITCKAHRCDCPNLKDGKLYLLSATYQKTWNRFILNTNTFWRDWHWYLSFQVKTFSRKCQNVSKQQF